MGGRAAGRVIRQGGVVVAGLALGVGAVTLLQDERTPDYEPHPASVQEFAFPTAAPQVTAPGAEPALGPAIEPADARAALETFLQSLADGRPEASYPLLDGPGRSRFGSVAAWTRAQADLARPLAFDITAARPASNRPGAVDFEVSATHRPSLDAVRGLVPAASQAVWQVRREGDTWRVSAEPSSFRPVLPPEGAATEVVQGWVDRLATCDRTAATELQVSASLYGPTGLVGAPCEKRGMWRAGPPVGIDATPDPRAFLAAFGPEVGTWARLVPVQGPGSRFLAAVAPMGDSWQVMGVAIAG